jgi:hypothetical protein
MSIPKFYSAINYDFRPESYWAPAQSPLEAALRNVKGRNRRAMIRDYHSRGLLPALSDDLLQDTLDEDTRQSLDLIHPSFMGGEYLPSYARCEVEIARIELESTTSDVISLRARPAGSRIRYRLVDEYQTEFRLPQQTSARPFSLHELIRLLDSVERVDMTDLSWDRFGFVLSYNQCNLECGSDLESLRLRDKMHFAAASDKSSWWWVALPVGPRRSLGSSSARLIPALISVAPQFVE